MSQCRPASERVQLLVSMFLGDSFVLVVRLSPTVLCLYFHRIRAMLTAQPEVMGVTFQRPVAPPPIVSGSNTGPQPTG